MKMIVAYINPFALGDVRDALKDAGVSGLSVSNIQGFGRQAGHTETYRGAEYQVDFLPKVKVEAIVEDGDASAVVEAITSSASTDKIGDGKIFVYDLEQVVRIRTGETGAGAL